MRCAAVLSVWALGAWVAAAQQDWLHVCTDAGAGGYEAFPDVCRLADGRLMAVFYAGYGHISLPNESLPNGGRISLCTSADEGQTWTAARTLFDGPYDDRDPSVTQLRDGRLILGLYKQTSTDAWGAVTISENGGMTWSAPVIIPNGGLRYEAETDVIELKDGALFAALRGQNHSGWSVSRDRGLTWSTAALFGFPGHCHYLHRTPDDILVMAHRLPDTSLHVSLDEGQTWSTNIVVDTVTGAYPSMVTLKDSSTLIVYYEEGTGSSVRAKRFRVTPAGFQWLSPASGWPTVRAYLNANGGRWTNTADWADGILPGPGEIADLSLATGELMLTGDVTVGEIHYNPVFSGTTNRLTILSDTGAQQ